MKRITHEIEVGGRTLTLTTGDIATFSQGSVLARYGDTMVLATVVVQSLREDPGYMPLMVEYVERLYAGGRIKGSHWVKREGRPSDEAILAGRLIDRSLRPLFPKDYRNEIQVMLTILSVDGENDPTILSAVAASAALTLSGTPWEGPVGVVRVGLVKDSFTVNPVDSEMVSSDLDLVVTGRGDKILMLEAGARQVPEERFIKAIEEAQKAIQKIEEGIRAFAEKVGVKELPYTPPKSDVLRDIEKNYGAQIEEWAKASSIHKTGEHEAFEIRAAIQEEFKVTPQESGAIFEKIVRQRLRGQLLKGERPDGRKPDQIREINIEVGMLPRTHGSALFTRGQTQALSVTTLGAPGLEQRIESAEGEETKRYMHHYSMPPYATGEAGRVGSPSRREIGHGALAERALFPVIPPEDTFPYAIRVVSEVLTSNGSTSMASVCGSTLSLMDAGVPIVSPVAGIAMGLVVDPSASPSTLSSGPKGSGQEKYVVLSDIAGIEDAAGDMDFKVAGTKDGVTALQLDVKTHDLTLSILSQALNKAHEGRLFILGKIHDALPAPREQLSVYAPRIVVLHIAPESIGEVIGPGGKTIRRIIAETGTQVEVEDDGSVNISGADDDSVQTAVAMVEGLTKSVQPGETYEGTVKRIQPFGAFVEVLPGKEGLVHISDLSDEYVEDPNTIVQIGQTVTVRVKEIDELGRINLTMRSGEGGEKKRGGSPRFREGGRRPRSRAPHFPASRFLSGERRRGPFR
ncbi:polyribonucleotide nucleotidyltransferase [Candidatus Microgenomates bacterium]|nr:polyribonucleotide nucleotidyltransferase [Candidatus Microgenomates bacterium]